MALNNNNLNESNLDEKTLKLRHKLFELKEKSQRNGSILFELPPKITFDVTSRRASCVHRYDQKTDQDSNPVSDSKDDATGSDGYFLTNNWTSKFAALFICLGILFKFEEIANISKYNNNSRCAIVNNYVVMEISRPVTDCDICRNVDSVLILDNVTRAQFADHAYAGRPILVKGATKNWSALETFKFDFFKKLYSETPGAFQSVEEECQFFPFRTEFLTLADVFNMSEERSKLLLNHETNKWYVGWSNCNPEVASVLREHYSRPHFLPDESEGSAIDWIFMGYSGQGASMHLDYVQRPSWQAQISGRKTWQLVPPPECELVCQSLTIEVNKGDIILIDTNQWYHDTYIHPGEISITIGSEYD